MKEILKKIGKALAVVLVVSAIVCALIAVIHAIWASATGLSYVEVWNTWMKALKK